jgi:hypothetical protein
MNARMRSRIRSRTPRVFSMISSFVPVEADGFPGEYGAALAARLVAYRDHVPVFPLLFEKLEDAVGLFAGYVDARFLHHVHDSRVENPRLEPGAFGLEPVTRETVQEGLGHLAPGGVVHAHEENSCFFHGSILRQPNFPEM